MTICRLFLLAVVQMLFTSCAAGIRTTAEQITVRTDPPGANVVLSTGEKGVTPYSVSKNRNQNFSVYVYKKGYKPTGVEWLGGAKNEPFPNRIEARLAPLNSSAHSIVLESGGHLPKYRTSPATKPKPPANSPPETYVAAPKKTPRLSPTARSSDKRVTNRNLPQPKRTPRLAQSTSPYRTDASGTLYLDGY